MRSPRRQSEGGAAGSASKLFMQYTSTVETHTKGGGHAMQKESREKKMYTAPELVVHGTVEEITADQNKGYGMSDGFLFMGNPIKNIS